MKDNIVDMDGRRPERAPPPVSDFWFRFLVRRIRAGMLWRLALMTSRWAATRRQGAM